MKTHERAANLALAGLSLAPLVINVNPNLNVILTACLTVYVGCYRSVKSTPPAETMSKEHAMRFPLVGSAMLLSLFLLFKFLSKDLVNTVLTAYFFILGIAALCATLLPTVKRFLPEGWNDNAIVWRAPYFHSLSVEFTKSQVVASVPGFFFCVWYAMKKHWLANNVLGLAFCIQGIEMLSLGSFKTGGILLAGLFVYDIFWVFFTPVMVSVAKSFDAPIKLLFPTADAARPFSMLGLGDIVIPGIFVALALRFDVSRNIKNRYFNSAFLGYTAGMIVTIVVMNWFQAAQPALLYIVPGVTGFVAVHSLWNGEVKPLLEFTETQPEEEGAAEKEDEDSSQSKKVD
ncbi:Minor histocompatibility antigen H13 [Triticum urartu]|uniref:Minor histocompatibility antigen H13 n=2 Tax=Triticum urartu TaxID=4572 RepID=M8AUD8_TRIUA|nr:signal peptide peptidase 2 [Triticum urartu]XP_048566202.1 signal peptide peptidase 2 [Triticum urartu]EMS68855.1 Minor histocompatibility antigen H13 [Triticum urartu]